MSPSFYERPSPAVSSKCAPGAEPVCYIPACYAAGDYKGRLLHKYWQVVEKALSLHRAGKKAEAEAMISDLSRDEGFSAAECDVIIREITRALNAETMK